MLQQDGKHDTGLCDNGMMVELHSVHFVVDAVYLAVLITIANAAFS